MATKGKALVDIGIVKSGAAGMPKVTVMVDGAASLEAVSTGLLSRITRNKDMRKKLGLKACPACISGMDFDIRHKFDQVLQIDLNSIGR